MSKDKHYTNKPIKISKITFLLIFLYVVLFEFIWVTQSIIPKPTFLIDSFFSLWSEYNLLSGFFETTAVVFPATLIAIIILEIFAKILLRTLVNFNGIMNIIAPFKYFSFFFLALLFNFLFPQSLIAELVFATLFVLSKLLKIVSNEKDSISEEYILSAKSLGLSESQIFSKVIWNSFKTKVYGDLSSIHTHLWVAVLVYEFIGSSIGLGNIYRLAFSYNDLLAIISLGIFVSIIILIVNEIIKFVVSKLIFWK